MIDPRIYDLLDSDDPAKRKQAVTLLGKSGDPAALKLLKDVYQTDTSEEIRNHARRGGVYLRKTLESAEQPVVTDGGGSATAILIGIGILLGLGMIAGVFINWIELFGVGGTGWDVVDSAFNGDSDGDVMNYSPLLLLVMGAGVILAGVASFRRNHRNARDFWGVGLLSAVLGAIPLGWFYNELNQSLEDTPITITDFLEVGFWLCTVAVALLALLSIFGLLMQRSRA